MLLADCGYKSFKLLGVNLCVVLARGAVEMVMVWSKRRRQLIVSFPAMGDCCNDREFDK